MVIISADAFEQMWQKQRLVSVDIYLNFPISFRSYSLVCFDSFRYNEIFFMIDTCQAASMYEKFYSPNILAVASSLVGEDSLSVGFLLFKEFLPCFS